MDDFWVIMDDFWVIMDEFLVSLGDFLVSLGDFLANCLRTEPQTDIVTTKACYSQAKINIPIIFNKQPWIDGFLGDISIKQALKWLEHLSFIPWNFWNPMKSLETPWNPLKHLEIP